MLVFTNIVTNVINNCIITVRLLILQCTNRGMKQLYLNTGCMVAIVLLGSRNNGVKIRGAFWPFVSNGIDCDV